MKKSLGAKIIVGATPVWVVGTYDKDGRPNIMTAAWAGVCCSDPPCIGVALRKATYTYGSIVEKKAFTVNVGTVPYAKEVDWFGIASGKDTDKFAKSGLTAVKSELVDAPYIQEFPLILECRLRNSIEIGLHTQFIGEIIDVKADESVLDEKGVPAIDKVSPFLFNPETRSYYKVGDFLGKAFFIGKEPW